MLLRIVGLLTLVSTITALTCYSYMLTSAISDNTRPLIECPPDAQYCLKSYLTFFDAYGNRSYTESHSCASAVNCQANGCQGNSQDLICCCSTDQCNSGTSISVLTTLTAIGLLYFLS
ncbi:unnamed protein product, partial [Mesorhabditis spiculigera]